MLDYSNAAARAGGVSPCRTRIVGLQDELAEAAPVGLPAGTRLAATRGLVPVENLAPGDGVRIPTGSPTGSVVEIAAILCVEPPEPVPLVHIPAGALGSGQPLRDVLLGQEQGVTVTAPALKAFAGSEAALVRAGDLVGRAGITLLDAGNAVAAAPGPQYHVVLAQPGLLPAEGLALAPFRPDAATLRGLSATARATLFEAMPRLRYGAGPEALDPGLPWLDRREVAHAVPLTTEPRVRTPAAPPRRAQAAR